MPSTTPLLPPDLRFDQQAKGLVLLVGLQAGPTNLDHEAIEVSLHGRGLATLSVKLRPRANTSVPPAHAAMVDRLDRVLLELAERPGLGSLPLGLCCGRAEAAAVVAVAARRAGQVKAVALLGGELSMPCDAVQALKAPLLLVVGPGEFDLLDNCQHLRDHLGPQVTLEVLPDEGHLFADSTLGSRKAELAAAWFARQLLAHPARPAVRAQGLPGRHLAEALAPRHTEVDGSS